MSLEIGPLSLQSEIPPSPPAEVLAAVERAKTRARELAAAGRELHFERDPDTGRIVVHVRDLDGNVLRVMPGSEALAVIAGAPV
jgi:hypothetical protein